MARQPPGSPGSAISSGPVTFRAALASDTASIADNLHGHPGLTRRGLGSELLAPSLRWVATVEPGWPMHLWVLAVNSAARRFYERHGGTLVEQAVKPMPDSSLPAVCRCISREPGRLVTPERSGAGRLSAEQPTLALGATPSPVVSRTLLPTPAHRMTRTSSDARSARLA